MKRVIYEIIYLNSLETGTVQSKIAHLEVVIAQINF